MDNARRYMCDMLYTPIDARFSESIRKFQGCPTIAITKGGRIYMGWYAGGTREPHMENYNILIYSDDGGETWSEPLLIIPSNKEKRIHALDIQVWVSPEGELYVFWVQNNAKPITKEEEEKITDLYGIAIVDGYCFDDWKHAGWVSVCKNPDDKEPVFSKGRFWDNGFLRCKPLVMSNGNWLFFNYDQITDRYGYSITEDKGNTFSHYYGAKKQAVFFDETMAYEKLDGSIRMLARCSLGQLAEATSQDYAMTWSDSKLSGIKAPDSRFFVSRTPSGRVLLIVNDHEKIRCRITAYLSEDDGLTWKYKKCIDEREKITYPDVDFYNDRIYLVYDHERTGAREILFTSFREEDILNVDYKAEIKIISKPLDVNE